MREGNSTGRGDSWNRRKRKTKEQKKTEKRDKRKEKEKKKKIDERHALKTAKIFVMERNNSQKTRKKHKNQGKKRQLDTNQKKRKWLIRQKIREDKKMTKKIDKIKC